MTRNILYCFWVFLFAVDFAAANWKEDLKTSLLNKEVMLRADVSKIRFRDSIGFGLGTGHDVTNFDKTGFYYKSGIYRNANAEDLKNRIHAEGVEVFRAGINVTLYEVDADDDNVKIKFKTSGDKGAVTFHFDKSEGLDGFQALYKQVFVVDNRKEILGAHPEWPAEIRQAIEKGDVEIGMDRNQVEATLGPPAKTKKSKTADGNQNILVYFLPTKTLEVTLVEGHVTQVDESEGQ